MAIKSILIDDEKHCLESLHLLLKEYCPAVEVARECRSAEEGLKAIAAEQPELVFLDVEMPVMNGFELLELLPNIPFSVIFTTSYDQYAIRAIRFSALDYLLKPINHKELTSAVSRVKAMQLKPYAEQFQMLLTKIKNPEHPLNRVAVPTGDGFELIPVETIMRCEADDNYTRFYLKNKKVITVCRSLKDVEEQLSTFPIFIRVHHSHLVNLNEVTRYVRGEGGYLILSDATAVHVSRSRKDAMLAVFHS